MILRQNQTNNGAIESRRCVRQTEADYSKSCETIVLRDTECGSRPTDGDKIATSAKLRVER